MLRIIQSQGSGHAKNYFTTADYYSEGQELTGRWRGQAARRLGLAGEIRQADWDSLCDNRDPTTGKRLTARTRSDRTVGYDFNFHVPKSVSLLYAVSRDERLVEALRDSVQATMEDMESEMLTRVRKGRQNEDRRTGNLAWGEFVHFTARPVDGVPDPHLHAHCFVQNLTYCDEEQAWKAGQFRELIRDAPYFEAVFHSRLAHRLSDLGLPIERTRHGWELARLTPGMVGRYFSELPVSPPTKKLHLAAIRALFDVFVQRHVILLNPAHSVRTERYSVDEGRTPLITVEQCRRLMSSIPQDSIGDLRDRAIIGVLIYTAARAGAVARLRLEDFAPDGNQHVLRFSEKRGRARSIPVRHDLEAMLRVYLLAGLLHHEPAESPLFRSLDGRRRSLTSHPLTGGEICRLVKRRVQQAGLPPNLSPHSFRAGTATDLLLQGIPLDDVQHLLGHSDSRVTKLYDRRQRQVTRNIVERISV